MQAGLALVFRDYTAQGRRCPGARHADVAEREKVLQVRGTTEFAGDLGSLRAFLRPPVCLNR
jgi:hypothetical protein